MIIIFYCIEGAEIMLRVLLEAIPLRVTCLLGLKSKISNLILVSFNE